MGEVRLLVVIDILGLVATGFGGKDGGGGGWSGVGLIKDIRHPLESFELGFPGVKGARRFG